MNASTYSLRRHLSSLLAVALVSSTLVLSAGPAAASVAGLPDPTAGANGTVVSVLQSGDRIYIGGTFSWVGPHTGSGIAVNTTDGRRSSSLARLNGAVQAAVKDGKGGWYVGGAFTLASGRVRNGAARITSSGALSSTWDANVTGTVRAIAVAGSKVYLGGSFSSVGGSSRSNLAAVDAATGAVDAWNADVNGPVDTLVASGDGTTLFVGGSFSSAGGAPRSDLAAISTSTGEAIPGFAADTDGEVEALALAGSRLFVGGSFSALGGDSRSNLAVVDATTGTVDPWAPDTDGTVRTLLVSGDGTQVFVGGSFSSAGGAPRSNVASVDAATGGATAWDPSPDGAVGALASSGSTVLVGGAFTSIGGQERPRAAAVDATTGSIGTWDPRLDAPVHAIAMSGSNAYVGGDFSMGNGSPRNDIAAIDATTGEVDLSWRADTDGEVRGLAISDDGGTLYLGGIFKHVRGLPRLRLAAVDAASGSPLSWSPKANGPVRTLDAAGNRVWAGGSFSTVGGLPRPYLAAIDGSSGAVDAGFSPSPDGAVRAIALTPDAGILYVGGFYGSIGGAPRDGAAGLDPTTGAATSFHPTQVGSDVIAVALSPDGSRFYLSTKGNKTNGYEPASGSEALWSIKSGGDVQAIAASATEVYVGGHFTKLDQNAHRNRIGSLDPNTGTPTSWNPGVDSFWGVWALQATPTALLVGGDFTKVAGKLQPHFARFPGTP